MIRKFKFEAGIHEWLNCLPMAARRKLDGSRDKLHLAQWEQLGRGERLMICHALRGRPVLHKAVRDRRRDLARGSSGPDRAVVQRRSQAFQETW